ncbi:hypothetical protein EPUS_02977 [Endocarpon pusillum Z07020]|uniref:Fork-head domain-containing protein n=1 Tax=Endocarpon pusillum (strain Z07020 / HMAS-L-300199) TaxID=1263415 RepID=U1GK23_ENDPU|nr:uncharacterized protein EPUS_02977 [Endocarpon pusillum Z07020]ERF72186.1 hypothetical protein EPUS_02977 [Endocarpon pusillum Z07020]
MELQQEDLYSKQPLLLGERGNYVETQPQYYNTVQGLVDHESIAHSDRTHAGTYRDAAPLLGLGLPTGLFQSNCFRDRWRYHETLEGQEQNYVPDFQPSPAQYLNQGFVYPSQPTFDEPCNKGGTSDVEVWKEDMTSSPTSPKIDSSPSMEVWPLESDESISAFCSESGMLTKDSQDDEEDSGDKPYARLIHEALMQAPGHRMMLREIYDWFVQNTTKPSESGTNGWQNSIRHNLSMNQCMDSYRRRDQAWSPINYTISEAWQQQENKPSQNSSSTPATVRSKRRARCQKSR